MSTKNQRLLNIAMILLSWLSIPLVGWRTIKRFLPASILAILITCIDVQIGKKRRWWSFYNKPQSFIQNEIPFLLGPMLGVSIWTLNRTYGNFKKFITLNAFFHAIFVFPITRLFTKLKMYKLVGLNEFQFFLYFFYKAFLLYGFQYIIENKKRFT
jgi:hypothetical protein